MAAQAIPWIWLYIAGCNWPHSSGSIVTSGDVIPEWSFWGDEISPPIFEFSMMLISIYVHLDSFTQTMKERQRCNSSIRNAFFSADTGYHNWLLKMTYPKTDDWNTQYDKFCGHFRRLAGNEISGNTSGSVQTSSKGQGVSVYVRTRFCHEAFSNNFPSRLLWLLCDRFVIAMLAMLAMLTIYINCW